MTSVALTERVAVVRIPAADPRREQYAVQLDDVTVLRCGSASRWDYCKATSFARGLAMGLAASESKDPR